MPTLYIANTTKQPHDFHYWMPDEVNKANRRIRIQTIQPGQQIFVFKRDLDLADIQDIIEQHLAYGLKSTNEIPRTKAYIGLCYSIDKPVDVDKFMVADEQNQDALISRNFELQKVAAVAIDQNLRQTTDGLATASTEISEQAKPGDEDSGRLQQVIEVTTGEPANEPAPKARQRRRA